MDREENPPDVVFGSFDNAETAKAATGGKVYECRGYENDAIIVEDKNGRNWLYVRPESPKYRDCANEVWGHRMSQDGRDADHIASRDIEGKQGQGYVLMGAVNSSANRSHGTFEKPGRHVDRPFNAASAGKYYAMDTGGTATPVSQKQSSKSSGFTKKQMAAGEHKREGQERVGPGHPEFETATFGNPEHQARLEEMKGRELSFDKTREAEPDYRQKLTSKMPWDRRQEEVAAKRAPTPPTKKH